jgi:hypothetical protein
LTEREFTKILAWLELFKKLAEMLLCHPEGILNYCRVRFGVVEAVNGTSKPCSAEGADTRTSVTCC